MIEHKGRLDLAPKASGATVSFEKEVPSTEYQMGLSVISEKPTKVQIDIVKIVKKEKGFRVFFNKEVPGRFWKLHYHVVHS